MRELWSQWIDQLCQNQQGCARSRNEEAQKPKTPHPEPRFCASGPGRSRAAERAMLLNPGFHRPQGKPPSPSHSTCWGPQKEEMCPRAAQLSSGRLCVCSRSVCHNADTARQQAVYWSRGWGMGALPSRSCIRLKLPFKLLLFSIFLFSFSFLTAFSYT